MSALSRLHKQKEPLDQVPGDILSLSYLWLPLCLSCVTFHRSRRRTRRPLQRQRSPVRDDRCWAARRAPTPRLRLLRLQRRSRGKRLASGCWLPKRLRPFGRIPLRRAQTASKSTSPKPRLASETDDGGPGIKRPISVIATPGKKPPSAMRISCFEETQEGVTGEERASRRLVLR